MGKRTIPKDVAAAVAQMRELTRRVLEKIRNCGAEKYLDNLVAAGADREEILDRLVSVYACRKRHLERPARRKAKSCAQQIRQSADLIESLNRGPGSETLAENIRVLRVVAPPEFHQPPDRNEFSFRQILAFPQALREYADRVEKLPDKIQIRWNPFRTTAIAQLVWYVKQVTGHYHDTDLSSLVGAILSNEEWFDMKQWRARHRPEIQWLGPLFPAIPHLIRKPRRR